MFFNHASKIHSSHRKPSGKSVTLFGHRKAEMSKLEISKNSHAGWRYKNLLRLQDRRLQLHRSWSLHERFRSSWNATNKGHFVKRYRFFDIVADIITEQEKITWSPKTGLWESHWVFWAHQKQLIVSLTWWLILPRIEFITCNAYSA